MQCVRPLFNLKSKGANLFVVNPSDNMSINPKHILRIAYDADFIGMNLASNVTGAVSDIEEVGKRKAIKPFCSSTVPKVLRFTK